MALFDGFSIIILSCLTFSPSGFSHCSDEIYSLFSPILSRRHEGSLFPDLDATLQPMNLTGGVLATRPPGKPLNGLFGERFSIDKRLVEDLTGGFFWESLSGSCLVTIWPFPGLPLPGLSALQEKEVGTETGMRPQESSDALYFFRVKWTRCQGG